MRFKVIVGAVCLIFGLAFTATATTISEGFSLAASRDMFDRVIGRHFPSITDEPTEQTAEKANVGPAGTKPGPNSDKADRFNAKADRFNAKVGNFSTAKPRVLSEYDRAGPSKAPSAVVNYKVFGSKMFGPAGLSSGPNDLRHTDDIAINAYTANNSPNSSTFGPIGAGALGSFPAARFSTDGTLNSDIASILSPAMGNGGGGSFGIQQAAAGDPNGGEGPFYDLQLTVGNRASVVPVPAALPLLLAGLAAIGLIARRKTVQNA